MANNDSANSIRNIRNTKDGKLLMILDKDQKALESIGKALKQEGGVSLSTRALGKEQPAVYHIRGMSGDTTPADITEATYATIHAHTATIRWPQRQKRKGGHHSHHQQEQHHHQQEAIIAGVFNAKSPLWGSPKADQRGEHMAEWIASLRLSIHNDGTPTFQRGASISHIDITLSTDRTASRIHNWKVPEDENMSLHKNITYRVDTVHRVKQELYRMEYMDKGIFREEMERMLLPRDTTPQNLTKTIRKAQTKATASERDRTTKQPYW
ncbi:hypothetical protein JTB14_020794 [Gonioctena quinquepunctata]|nr:hypothetical protein JTB14_020794 [Gonioctena quinquepunctata]